MKICSMPYSDRVGLNIGLKIKTSDRSVCSKRCVGSGEGFLKKSSCLLNYICKLASMIYLKDKSNIISGMIFSCWYFICGDSVLHKDL